MSSLYEDFSDEELRKFFDDMAADYWIDYEKEHPEEYM